MFGRIVLVGLLGTAIFAGVAWYMGLIPVLAQDSALKETQPKSGSAVTAPPVERTREIGSNLYAKAGKNPPAMKPQSPELDSGVSQDLIVIPSGRIAMIRKQDVPSQRDGVLKFVGIQLREGERVAADEKIYEVTMDKTVKKFRRLREGDFVAEDQLLALVDDTLARAELNIKEAKITAAKAEKEAAEKTKDEAEKRYDTQKRLYNNGNNPATSYEDVRGAHLTWIRYVYEEKGKAEAITVALQEREQAKKTVQMYEVHAKISGVVKQIYRRDGEAVKQLEPILQIQNYDKLRVEGLLDEQYARALKAGQEVLIEPIRRERPLQTFKGHRLEVTGVAVSNSVLKPLIVSSSEDMTCRVWDISSNKLQRVLPHPTAVRAVACTPPGVEANLCLSGAADGRGRIWDLNGAGDKPLRELAGQHRGAIASVAFSPDGKICATAGEDGDILIWNTADGAQRYTVSGHRTVVTSVHFTPQSQLVSASRDNTVRVWKLGADGAQLQESIRRRSTDVGHIGVSPDGQHILDAQGQEMRILSLATGLTEGILHNPSQSSTFRTFALFSPDGKLVLTSSTAEGQLQLWRTSKDRSYEIRQLIPSDHFESTCAAFAPNGSFVVGGTKDRRVYAWPMPPREEVDTRLTATITNIEQVVESSDGQVRIMAEFDNPQSRRLFPGDAVTIVAIPK